MNRPTPRLFFSLIAFGYLLAVSPVFATTINVNTTADEYNTGSNCSLREAIQAANTNAAFGGCPAGQNIPTVDEVVIPSGTYTLTITGANNDTNTTGDLDVSQSVTFTGATANPANVVIQAGPTPFAGIDRVFHIVAGVSKNVTFRYLTVQNGCAQTLCGSGGGSGGGGGLEANAGGIITIEHCIFQGGQGTAGGGVHFFSDPAPLQVTMTDSIVQNNRASIVGGGMSNHANGVFRRVIFANNSAINSGNGGAFGIPNGTTRLIDSTLSGNTSANNGGAITIQGHASSVYGALIATNSTISGNSANGNGGGIYVNGGIGGTGLSNTACNPASCIASLYNTTLSNNTADADNGGIAGNGGGFYINQTGTYPGILETRNSIIAGNADLSGGAGANRDCSGNLVTFNYNIIGNNTGCSSVTPAGGDIWGTAASPVNALLGPLANNGVVVTDPINNPNPTETSNHALQTSSPAINGGNPAGCTDGTTPLTADQRGYTRPQGGRCDMGSYELQAVPVCGNGTVESGEQCDDSNTSNGDGCSSACQYETGSCDDGNACTTGETWQAGICAGGSALSCNDGNGCTDDSCNPASGCQYANNTSACSDGNACTSGDTCSAGVCAGGSPLSCDDGNGCTTDSCSIIAGCQHSNNANSCDDGNTCTTNDACSAGSCTGGAPLNCNDSNGCTDDSCNPANGCQNNNNTASCSDGDACTTGDACSAGSCSGGTPLSCNDGNGCTDDSCNPASGCQYGNNTDSCNDGNACTVSDQCSGGACSGTGSSCGDGNLDSVCSEECDDGNNDNGDGCDATCQNEPPPAICGNGALEDGETCDDGNTLNGDCCNSICAFEPADSSCDDANVCTTTDTCSGDGICSGAGSTCGNSTVEAGCNEQCDDGGLDNGDGCGSTCQDEYCGDGSVNNNGTEQCDDGNLTNGDGCDSACQNEPPPVTCGNGAPDAGEECDDGNMASGDGCNSVCQNEFCGDNSVNNSGTEQCDDGNTVNGDGCDATCHNEVCGDGSLNNAGTEQCDDGNTANGDCCSTACQFEGAGSSCNDGNACTATDICNGAGTCSGSGSTCGNGTLNGGCGETCDDGNTASGDGCNSTCHTEYCGDSVVNDGGNEQCDDGNASNGDGCNSSCDTEYCGDGAVNNSGTEQCDDGNTASGDGCSSGCQIEDALSLMSDSYDGSSLNPAWANFPVPGGGYTNYSVSGGSLGMNAHNSTTVWFQTATGALLYKNVNSRYFKVTTTVHVRRRLDPSQPMITGASQMGGIVLRNPSGSSQNNMVAGVGDMHWASNLQVILENTTNAVTSVNPFTPSWLTAPDAEVRLCRVDSTFYLYARAVGATNWGSPLISVTRADLPTQVQVGTTVFTTVSTYDTRAVFDRMDFATVSGVGQCTEN